MIIYLSIICSYLRSWFTLSISHTCTMQVSAVRCIHTITIQIIITVEFIFILVCIEIIISKLIWFMIVIIRRTICNSLMTILDFILIAGCLDGITAWCCAYSCILFLYWCFDMTRPGRCLKIFFEQYWYRKLHYFLSLSYWSITV